MKQEIYKLNKEKEKIENLVKELRKKKKKLVFTNGCFDIIHVGHLRYLKAAKELGDVLIIGLNSDKSVKKIKGDKRPINPEIERAELLASLKFVDFVMIFDEEDPLNLIKVVEPDLLVKGGDWKIEKLIGAEHVKSYGGKVQLIQFETGFSSTNMIERILNKYKE